MCEEPLRLCVPHCVRALPFSASIYLVLTFRPICAKWGLLFVHYSVFDAGSGLSVEWFTSMSNAARIAKKTCMKETPYHTACPSF